ncbi:MAG: aminomethyl-transferring glycine dehydrogenase [Bacteroidales bacterium]
MYQSNSFVSRHVGPRPTDIDKMLDSIGVKSMNELIDKTVPKSIRLDLPLDLPSGLTERQYIRLIGNIADKNKIFNTYIGMGFYDTITPSVILRNVLENPVWYTSYTPYQAEISQGRLEALLNYQTMIMELTAMPIANASLLDESSAAAEAMIMMYNARSKKDAKEGKNKLIISRNIWEQTIKVLETRATPYGIELTVVDDILKAVDEKTYAVITQFPDSNGAVFNNGELISTLKNRGIQVAIASDLLSLALFTPPGEFGADVTFGTSQRFGVPMGFGGPSAAFFACTEDYKRQIPGRIIGISKDINGNEALRMALQTREQHIKREKATSNICTAQALLATMAGFYGVYHGAEGIKSIANRIHAIAQLLEKRIVELGYKQINKEYFDTITFEIPDSVNLNDIKRISLDLEMNFRYFENENVGISIDETTNLDDINWIIETFSGAANKPFVRENNIPKEGSVCDTVRRNTAFMQQSVFKKYRSETEMMRYIKKLERKDISLTHSMISLGSCTMKLNAATEMLPLSWIKFNGIHPFVPKEQAAGYHWMMTELCQDLAVITGFDSVSLQPNSGASGELSGLMVIKEYHKSIGEGHRKLIIIPASAHGTNPASAAMAGMDIKIVPCDDKGNIDIDALRNIAEENKDVLSAAMITYPSTHGVFEEKIVEMCQIIHDNGGQVYMDGANMNAQVGITNPGFIGADLCHLNLHKTFAIPHGGGGPGAGPICVAKHLTPFLPSHPIIDNGAKGNITVAAAPWGSASILPITYGYIKMLGADGLKHSTETAILNANYLVSKLKDNYGIVYTGENGFVAHEMILECRHFKSLGINETDIAKRLVDFGFHAPTLSFPVIGTLMVEPTESESLEELDRFVEALNTIFNEIKEIENGTADKEDNVLKNAPHTAEAVTADKWTHTYSRRKAAYPLEWLKDNKYWSPISRIDNAYGDRNLVCSCSK